MNYQQLPRGITILIFLLLDMILCYLELAHKLLIQFLVAQKIFLKMLLKLDNSNLQKKVDLMIFQASMVNNSHCQRSKELTTLKQRNVRNLKPHSSETPSWVKTVKKTIMTKQTTCLLKLWMKI